MEHTDYNKSGLAVYHNTFCDFVVPNRQDRERPGLILYSSQYDHKSPTEGKKVQGKKKRERPGEHEN